MRPDPLTSAIEELERAVSGFEAALEKIADLLEEPRRPRAGQSPAERPELRLVQGGKLREACHD